MLLMDLLARTDFRNQGSVDLDEPDFALLAVDWSSRYVGGRYRRDVLTFEDVFARHPGRGAFSGLLQRLRAARPDITLTVSHIANARFRDALSRWGFRPVPDEDGDRNEGIVTLLPEQPLTLEATHESVR